MYKRQPEIVDLSGFDVLTFIVPRILDDIATQELLESRHSMSLQGVEEPPIQFKEWSLCIIAIPFNVVEATHTMPSEIQSIEVTGL